MLLLALTNHYGTEHGTDKPKTKNLQVLEIQAYQTLMARHT